VLEIFGQEDERHPTAADLAIDSVAITQGFSQLGEEVVHSSLSLGRGPEPTLS